MSTSPQSPVIEFWFDLASTYSYFSVMRIEEAAARAGVAVQWKPFLLGPIFQSFGWTNSPFVLQKEKGEYMWKDMAHQSRKYGLPWQQPSSFPRNSVLPVRVAMLGAQEPWIGEFCKGIMLASFAHDQDISRPEVVGHVLSQIGLSASQVLDEAVGDANKLALRQQTEEAARRKVFGAPTFF
ncbi:MAG: hypothetical protein RLZZ271_596, partial [Pseudomonadota bacterium]